MLKFVPLFIFTMLISGCSHKPKPPHKPSNYAPIIAPAVLPPTVRDANDPSSEPGSPTSPQIQQLPKASP